MARSKKISVDRRGFLKGAAVGAAALVAKPEAAKAQEAAEVRRPATPPPLPGTKQTAAETTPPPHVDVWTTDRPGSDFMVDVIKTLGFEYVAANPGSAFRGIHESLINYGGNKAPELLTCMHEESSIAMAHGYYKIEGKPMMVMAHGTVGLQHASMAIYNAYADRVPVYLLLGNIADGAWRRSDVEWAHSVQDAAAMVRDYTKWDDSPVSLGGFAESAVRAYKIAMTPPMEPIVIVADAVLQEEPLSDADRAKLQIPKLTLASPPAGDYGAIKEAAKMLVNAESPTIIAGRVARTPEGIQLLVELAETLQAPIIDKHFRMNFPTTHPLYGAGSVGSADVLLGLEVPDMWQNTHTQTPVNKMGMESKRITKPGAKVITIFAGDLYGKSNYQDFGRYDEVDLAIAADAQATLPFLIDECRKLITPERKAVIQARAPKLAEVSRRNRERDIEQAAWAWDASPVSTARMAAELWNQIKTEDWSLVSDLTFVSNWPGRLWDFDQALSIHRRARRLWRRLRCSGRCRRGSRQQETRAHQRQHPVRRGFELRSRRALDGRASSHSDAEHHAQQSRVPSGIDVRGRHGRPRAPRRGKRLDRNRDYRSECRLRDDGQGVRHVQRRSHRQPERSGTRH